MKQNLTIKPEPLGGLTVFRVVARAGSFSRAAAHLGVSASAISQSVRALEARLGVALLNRTSRRVALSEAGRTFLEQIDGSLDQIDLAIQQVRSSQGGPSGLLRINVSRLATSMLIEPRLAEFLARYPQLKLELFTDDALSDVVAGGFDAGIRIGHVLAKDMIALPVDAGHRRLVVATPDYLRRFGVPRTPADLAAHDCIRFRFPGSGRLSTWQFVDDNGLRELEVEGRLIFADDRLTRVATRAGLGVSQQFEPMVIDDLARGTLVCVLEAWTPPLPGFYIYYPARRLMPPKLRVFIDFLREPLLPGANSTNGANAPA